MIEPKEAIDRRQPVQVLRHGLFERRRRCHIEHLPAAGAQQVVMVLGYLFRQLEPGVLIVGRHPPHDPCLLQVDEVAVGRAPGQPRCPLGDVFDAYGVACLGQQFDNFPPPHCVPLRRLP